MQLESLKVFCDVARFRSFSQAATANHVSQSAVSQMVSQLEGRLGAQLIDRSIRPLQLTTLGQTYYDGCRDLLERFQELEATIKGGRGQQAAIVQVAAIYSVGLRDMSPYVERGRQVGIQVHMEYHHPDQVCEKVENGVVDLGLVSFPKSTRKLMAVPWREEEMVLVLAPAHPLARKKHLDLNDLSGIGFVHFEKGLTIRREVDRYLREQGLAVEPLMEFDNIENIKRAVADLAGVALLPAPTLKSELKAGTLVARPLFGARLVRPLGIIHRRQPRPSNAALRFIELLRQPDDKHDGSPQPAIASNGHHRGRNGVRQPQ